MPQVSDKVVWKKLSEKLMHLRYTWMVDVLILRTVWAYVMKLVIITVSRGKGCCEGHGTT